MNSRRSTATTSRLLWRLCSGKKRRAVGRSSHCPRSDSPGPLGSVMKNSSETDELRLEYDFSQMKGGVRGKYVAAYRRGNQPPAARAGDRAETGGETDERGRF